MPASEPAPARAEGRDRGLAATIERRLADEAGIYAAVRVAGGVAYLDGMVESAEQRDAATDLVGRIRGVARVQNDLDVEQFGALPAAPCPGIPCWPPRRASRTCRRPTRSCGRSTTKTGWRSSAA